MGRIRERHFASWSVFRFLELVVSEQLHIPSRQLDGSLFSFAGEPSEQALESDFTLASEVLERVGEPVSLRM
jgi:hypothetical protein